MTDSTPAVVTDEELQGVIDAFRRRMLIMFVGLVVALVGFGVYATKHTNDVRDAERQSAKNCLTINVTNTRINQTLDHLMVAALSATTLTPEERRARAEAYASLHLPIVHCPPAV